MSLLAPMLSNTDHEAWLQRTYFLHIKIRTQLTYGLTMGQKILNTDEFNEAHRG